MINAKLGRNLSVKTVMLTCAIVLPAGSGKTTLAAKYDWLVDIDALHTPQFASMLRLLYDETCQTDDWDSYVACECDYVRPLLEPFPASHVLMVHCAQKATVLGLRILGAWKPCRDLMERVAAERCRHGRSGDLVRRNWLIPAEIVDTFTDLEREVVRASEHVLGE
jgi:hypothetical protein